jgi:hypothetical protein
MNVLCRHCFQLFDFRRVGVLCRSQRCAAVLDAEGRRRPRFMLPELEKSLWEQRGARLDLQAPCPYCGEPGRLVPACPRCRQPLDPEVGAVEDRIIAILGARESGKSHYLATLLHLLLRGKIGGDVWDVTMDPTARQTAEELLLRPLFDELKELPATSRGLGPELPLVLTHRGDGRRVLLAFRDLSGEVMADPQLLEEVQFLRYAEGVVLLADPATLERRVRKRPQAAIDGQVTCSEILHNYLVALQTLRWRPGDEELAVEPNRKFLAVAVNKADLVLRSNHAFWSPNGRAHLMKGFWKARAIESRGVGDWLHLRLADRPAFAESVGKFADVSYFFASSFGYRHIPHTRSLSKPPQPLRVHEPIFALIDRFASERETTRTARGQTRATRHGVVQDDEDVL